MARKNPSARKNSGTRRTKATPGALPKRSSRTGKRAVAAKTARSPLPDMPGARTARLRIAEYADLIASTGRTIPVLSRKKPVALLGPVGSLPRGQQAADSISISELANGTRKFTAVVHHGPYTVTRNGPPVMVLYSSTKSLASMVESLIDALDELRLLDEARTKRLEIRRRADDAIRKRIAVLRQNGESAAADKLEDELRKLNDGI